METRKREPVIPESYDDLLRSTAVAHIATIGPHGEPQNNPVCFGRDGEYLKFSQTKARQKYRNLKRDPRIAVSSVDPKNHLRYLEVRGQVGRIDEDPNLDFINEMANKYLGLEKYSYHQPGDERVVMLIEPRHATYMN